MNKQGSIGPRGALIIAVAVIMVSFFYAPTIAADYGGSAAWLVILLAGVFAMAAAVLPWLLMRRFPDQTVIETGYLLAGRYLGFIVGLLFFSYFLLDMSLGLRLTAERIQVVYMPSTPLSVMMLALLLVGAVGAYLGLEAIARAIVIASGILLVSVLLPLALTYNFWNGYNLVPWLGSGVKSITIGGLSMMGLFSDILLLALINPSLSKGRGGLGNIWTKAVFWSVLLGLVVTVGTQLVFPYPVLNENLFPLAQVSRLVYASRFIQRIDAFLAFFWFGGFAFRFSLVYLLTMFSLAQLLRLPYHHPFLYSLGVIAFALGMLPHDIMDVTYIATGVFWRTGWLIAFILPGILLLVSQFRGQEAAK